MEHFRSQNFKDYVRFSVEDGSDVTVSARAYFDPATPTHESYWSDSKATVEQLSENEYKVSLGDHGDAAEPPSKYWINVTDSNGNSRSFLLSVQRGAPAYIARASVFVTGVAAIPKTDPVPEEIAGLLVLPITFAVYGGVNAYIPADGTVYRAPISGTERIYEGTVIGKVALASGFTETATASDEIVRRGRGWEHIAATTSLTQTDIGEVLENPDRVVSDGDVRYVIDELSPGASVVLIVIGGTLLAASVDTYATDPCNLEETIDLEDQEDHYTRDPVGSPEKPFDDRSTVKKLFDDVVEVFVDQSGTRYYVVKVSPNEWTVMVIQQVTETMAKHMRNGWANWRLKTFLTDIQRGRSLFQSYDDAVDSIKKDRMVNKVDC